MRSINTQPCNSIPAIQAPINIRYGVAIAVLTSTLTFSPLLQARTNLLTLSLEELMSVEVTSVSKKSQSLYQAAAAVHVISEEDIRRSGMTTIPELLRMVPGIQVSQQSSNQWAISARGFSDSTRANKLLVLMDGRTLYTPLFSGVYWDVQDTPLSDIERIEVIRGPGGTLWGANAVNGVINIITKSSADTQGGLTTLQAGNHEQGVTLRYGGKLGESGTGRLYAKVRDYDAFGLTIGGSNSDSWEGSPQIGFRTDWNPSVEDRITLQGDLYRIDALGDRYRNSGENLLVRWTHAPQEQTEWEFQGYFDRAERSETFITASLVETIDLDFNHRFQQSATQEISWGVGYRHIKDEITPGTSNPTTTFNPTHFSQDLYSAFIQDEILLADDLTLTVGSKFEHNDYTGFEIQPSARMLWNISQNKSLWGAVSRAVRTPSRSNRDILVTGDFGFGATTLASGNDTFDSEEVISLEIGCRSQVNNTFSIDNALYYNQYDHLYSLETGNIFDNQIEAESYGLEISANWVPTDMWRLFTSYSWQQTDARTKPGSSDMTNVTRYEDAIPEQQLQLHAYWNIDHNLELDSALYFTDKILSEGSEISDYSRLDLRLNWQVEKDIAISLVGQNLQDPQHPEVKDRNLSQTEVPRTIYGEVTFHF